MTRSCVCILQATPFHTSLDGACPSVLQPSSLPLSSYKYRRGCRHICLLISPNTDVQTAALLFPSSGIVLVELLLDFVFLHRLDVHRDFFKDNVSTITFHTILSFMPDDPLRSMSHFHIEGPASMPSCTWVPVFSCHSKLLSASFIPSKLHLSSTQPLLCSLLLGEWLFLSTWRWCPGIYLHSRCC